MTEQVGGVDKPGGIPGDASKPIKMDLLAGRRIFGGIDEDAHAVMEREEGLPLCVSGAVALAKLREELGEFLQEVQLGMEVLVDLSGLGPRAGLGAYEMDYRG